MYIPVSFTTKKLEMCIMIFHVFKFQLRQNDEWFCIKLLRS